MKTIWVYDTEERLLDKTAEANDMTMPELIEMLCEYLPQMVEENGMK